MPPWTKKQEKTAQAVAHGWVPKGSAKGFDKAFASQVIEESDGDKVKRKTAEGKLGKGAKMAPKH